MALPNTVFLEMGVSFFVTGSGDEVRATESRLMSPVRAWAYLESIPWKLSMYL
jgi:hypothetical protein